MKSCCWWWLLAVVGGGFLLLWLSDFYREVMIITRKISALARRIVVSSASRPLAVLCALFLPVFCPLCWLPAWFAVSAVSCVSNSVFHKSAPSGTKRKPQRRERSGHRAPHPHAPSPRKRRGWCHARFQRTRAPHQGRPVRERRRGHHAGHHLEQRSARWPCTAHSLIQPAAT